jgi:ABC-type branched-subunit amino acid transport system ATPase component
VTARLEIDDVCTSYGRRPLLRHIDLTVAPGEIVGVIGPNGSGKSTLLKAVVGSLEIDAGAVRLDGCDMGRQRPGRRRRLGIAMKTQMPRFVPSLTVDENVRLADNFDLGVRSWMRSRARPIAAEGLDRTPLAGRGGVPARELSHGEQQWLNLLATFSRNPRLVLLDEPAAGMSDSERQETERLITSLKGSDCSVMIIDHDLDLIQRLCERIVVLANGELVAAGTPEEIRASPAVREAYLDGARRD